MFKFLSRQTGSTDRASTPTAAARPGVDAELLARLAKAAIADRRGTDEARLRLTDAYQLFLGQLDKVYKAKHAEQLGRIEANYAVWAAFYELMKQNFKDLWDFLGVVQADVEGWHRVSPTGSPQGFMTVGREGYSFSAGIEQNEKRGAPFPKKWITVSLAHNASYPTGIGDERMLGLVDPVSDDLLGLDRCQGKSGDSQEASAIELKKRALAYPLVFTIYSEAKGQHMSEIPVSKLETFSLTELCQALLVALTNDDLEEARKLLSAPEPLLLK
jgi:hypothetical protein